MSSIKEADVIKVFKEYLKKVVKKFDLHKIHISPIHNTGFPDLILVYDSKVLFIESKKPNGQPTDVQMAVLKRLQSNGALTAIMDCCPTDKTILRFFDLDKNLLLELNTKEHGADIFASLYAKLRV